MLVRGGGARGPLGAAVAEFGELELDVRLGAEPLDGEEEAGVGTAHLVKRERDGDRALFVHGEHFVLDFGGDRAVALEFAEFVEGPVGAAFVLGGDEREAFHEAEGRGVEGIFGPLGLGVDLEEAEALGHKEGPGVALEGFDLDVSAGEAFGEEALAEGEELGSFVWLLVEEVSGELGQGDGLGVSHEVAPVKFVLRGERTPTGESVAWGGAGDGGDEGEVIEGRGDKKDGICGNRN